MNKTVILNKYKNINGRKKLLGLKDGGVVIGTEVDEENKLYYIIEKNGKLLLKRAKGQKVSEIVWHRDSIKVTVPII